MRNHGVEFYPDLVQQWGQVQPPSSLGPEWYRYRGQVKWLPQRDDFRNFLMSPECAEMAKLLGTTV
jgi:hypothetical protein